LIKVDYLITGHEKITVKVV